ncbi:MAG: hypothetical protein IPO09_15460 [Anaeromyxobacter sp.]|nr:hypothetical protein [Anaeromyxobacter sp.]
MSLVLAGAAVLLVGAVLALGLRDNLHRGWAAILTQALASGLVLAGVLPVLLGGGEVRATVPWSYPIDAIAVHLDPLGAFFLAWSLPMTLLGTVYALGYLKPSFQTRNAGVQFALLNVTSISFVMIYTLESAFVFLLGWEIAAVAAWLLVVWDYRNQRIRFAGFNYLVSTHIGLFFLLAAFMVMHSQTASMDFQAFGAFLRGARPLAGRHLRPAGPSFALKSAFFPFHTWLPRAHSAAPAHVSALMSGVIHKAGIFGLLRFTLLLGTPEEWMGWSCCFRRAPRWRASSTTTQRDLKRLLGYSSTENVGIAGMGFGVGTWAGLARAGPGGARLHRRPPAPAQPRGLQVPALLRGRRHLSLDPHRRPGAARRAGAAAAVDGGLLPAGRAGHLRAAPAQRVRRRVPHLRGAPRPGRAARRRARCCSPARPRAGLRGRRWALTMTRAGPPLPRPARGGLADGGPRGGPPPRPGRQARARAPPGAGRAGLAPPLAAARRGGATRGDLGLRLRRDHPPDAVHRDVVLGAVRRPLRHRAPPPAPRAAPLRAVPAGRRAPRHPPRTRSLWAGRKGPRLLQSALDLRRLLRKRPVYGRTTTILFAAGPLVVLATTLVARPA